MKKFYAILIVLLGFSIYSTAQVIDLVGIGMYNNSTANIAISDPGSIYEMTIGTIYDRWPNFVEGDVNFYDNDEDEQVQFVQLPIYMPWDPVVDPLPPYPELGSFTTTFTSADEDGINVDVLDPDDEAGMQAFYAFLYRDLAAPSYYSESVLETVGFYHNGSTDPYVYNVPILTDSKKRNIKVKVALAELDQDSRTAIIDVTAGDVTHQEIVTTYSEGESLYLGEYLLEGVGKNETNVEVSIYSPDPATDGENGDSFIVPGVVVDVDTRKHCTYSQWFYGSYCAKVCYETHVDDFLEVLLYEDLVLGGGDNTLTLTKDDVDCLMGRLPGYGPSDALDGEATCSDPVGIALWYGHFKNSLLTQAITLGLNLRADGFLGDLRLEGNKFKTWKAKDCSDPLSGKKGKARTYYLSQDVLDHLGDDNTINDLFALANTALAGDDIGDLCIWQVTCALSTINCAFNKCKILKKFYDSNKDSEIDELDDGPTVDMTVYPNPMRDHGTIEFTTMETGQTTIELYNIMGERIEVLMTDYTEEFTPIRVDMETYKYPKGMYILYIRNGSNVYKEKITIVN